MTPGQLRNRTQRYSDFINGVCVALSTTQISAQVAVRMYAELVEGQHQMELQVNNYRNPATGEFMDLEDLIMDYLHCRVNGSAVPEWMRHAGLSAWIS